MSFSTPQSVTLTATAPDANRIQAAQQGLGFASIKAFIIWCVMQQVSAYEHSQNGQTFAASYTPIAPS